MIQFFTDTPDDKYFPSAPEELRKMLQILYVRAVNLSFIIRILDELLKEENRPIVQSTCLSVCNLLFPYIKGRLIIDVNSLWQDNQKKSCSISKIEHLLRDKKDLYAALLTKLYKIDAKIRLYKKKRIIGRARNIEAHLLSTEEKVSYTYADVKKCLDLAFEWLNEIQLHFAGRTTLYSDPIFSEGCIMSMISYLGLGKLKSELNQTLIRNSRIQCDACGEVFHPSEGLWCRNKHPKQWVCKMCVKSFA